MTIELLYVYYLSSIFLLYFILCIENIIQLSNFTNQ